MTTSHGDDPATRKVIAEEFELLGLNGRPKQSADGEGPVALCLSGGGIRSATFSLGVLQGLAQMGRLKDFHYLSTVSGGGYIGAWLSAWIRRAGFDQVQKALRESAMGRGEAEPIRWLRRYSNFLAPVRGWSADSMTLVATFARNLILHWLLLIPILALVLLLPRVLLAHLGGDNSLTRFMLGIGLQDPEWRTIIAPTAAILLLWLLVTISISVVGRFLSESVRDRWARYSGWMLIAVCIWFLLSLFVIKLPIWILELDMLRSDTAAATASIGSAIIAIGSALAGYWSKQGPKIREKASTLAETFGVKLLEIASIASMLVILLMITLLTSIAISYQNDDQKPIQGMKAVCESAIPLVLDLAKSASPAASISCQSYLNHCGDAVPTASSFWLKAACTKSPPTKEETQSLSNNLENEKALQADSKSKSIFLKSRPDSMAVAAGTKSYDAAPNNVEKDRKALQKNPKIKPNTLKDLDLPESIAIEIAYRHRVSLNDASTTHTALIILVVMWAFGSWVGLGSYVNMFSLGAMYGNRLTRAYLGASNPPCAKEASMFAQQEKDDCVHYDDFDRYKNEDQRPRLFHIINTALNLTRPSADTLEWQQRKAASFVMTPRHCGSAVTGYTSTQTYDDPNSGITTGRAIAVSGAAVSPNMGYHSSRFVSMLLALFNIRLGYWAQNPGAAQSRRIGILLSYREFASRIDTKSRHVYLSDGGHFENLGLYEMIRRHCRRILVVDAGHDPNYRYEDLENAIRKIRTDFGVEIIPEKPRLTPDLARTTGHHFMMARVIYPAEDGELNEEGRILLLKPVLSGDEQFDLLRYAEATRSKTGTNGQIFPQHPTSDQFFDESQFESYRALGQHSVMTAFRNIQGWPDLDPDALKRTESELNDLNTEKHQQATPPPWAPPVEKASYGQSLFQAIGSTGQSALLASALTVTGVIGISGAVSLINPTLSIDKDSRQLSGTVTLSPPGRETNGHDKPQNDGLADRIHTLDKEVNRLKDKIAALEQVAGKPTPDLTALAEELKKSLVNLQSIATSLSQSTGNTAATSAKLAEITKRLSEDVAKANRLIGSIDSKGRAGAESNPDVLDRLGTIEADLKKVSSELKRNSPRNNTRSAHP